jgi:hypothetical protein
VIAAVAVAIDRTPASPSTFMSPDVLAAEITRIFGVRITVKTLANWRSEGVGPEFMKVGRHVRYRGADVARWAAAQRRRVD